jgi:hypothetical protein
LENFRESFPLLNEILNNECSDQFESKYNKSMKLYKINSIVHFMCTINKENPLCGYQPGFRFLGCTLWRSSRRCSRTQKEVQGKVQLTLHCTKLHTAAHASLQMRSLQAQAGRCHSLGYHLYRQVHKTFLKENIEADIFENTEPKSMKNAETKKSLSLETQFFH